MIEFFRVRHAIYVEEKQWREDAGTGMEVDQFDTERAVYLLGIDGDEIIAGSRLLSTMVPHMLSEVFPTTCRFTGVVRRPDVAEWTRGFVVKEHRHGPIKAQICAAVMEYCLSERISWVGGIQDGYWLPFWRRMGWTVVPIGQPEMVGGRRCFSAYMEVTQQALESARRQGNLDRSNLVHNGPREPFILSDEPDRAAGSTKLPLRINQRASLEYIRDMLLELRDMAGTSRLPAITYFIEMALMEASDTVRLNHQVEKAREESPVMQAARAITGRRLA